MKSSAQSDAQRKEAGPASAVPSHSVAVAAPLSAGADNRAGAVQQRLQQRAIDGSPRQVSQRQQAVPRPAARPNRTGLPDQLKAGIESLSGHSLDDVKVHYNSAKPAQLKAHAYAQGTDIHVGPGQEQHLPHEAWHVVQQKQGRVQPTTQAQGIAINDERGLENEADRMGKAAMQRKAASDLAPLGPAPVAAAGEVAQLLLVKVTTKKGGPGTPRVITRLDIAERAPTTAETGQGDHTVSEALMELTLINFVEQKTHEQVAVTLPALLLHLEQQARARFLDDSRHFVNVDYATLNLLIQAYQEMVHSGAEEGEDLNEALANILDQFIRLWNKRAGGAYNKSVGKTTGGKDGDEEKKGSGQVEKKAKKEIKAIGEKSKAEGGSEQLAADLAAHVVTMVDFKIGNIHDIAEAARHLAAAIDLALEAYPDMEFSYYDVMVFVVRVFAQRAGLTKEQHDILFELVHAKVTPYGEEDYADYEPKTTKKVNYDKGVKEHPNRAEFVVNDWDGRSLPHEVFRYFILTQQNSFIVNGMILTITKFNQETNEISYSIRPPRRLITVVLSTVPVPVRLLFPAVGPVAVRTNGLPETATTFAYGDRSAG